MLNNSLDHLHKELWESLKMLPEFVLNSLRHSFGTRLGEGGTDAFSNMRLMGHSSVTISQRYVHPTPEALGRAVERLELLNRDAIGRLPDGGKLKLPERNPAPISSTSGEPVSVSH